MRSEVYSFLVNRHPGISYRYHKVHDDATGMRRMFSWAYLLWINFAYYVLFCRFLGRIPEIYNETTHQLEYASNSIENDLSSVGDNGTSTAEDELWKEVVQRCFEQHTQLSAPGFEALPLVVDAAGDSRCVGVLYLERQESVDQETAHLLLELIARYIAIVVFNAVVKLATKYRDIEAAQIGRAHV